MTKTHEWAIADWGVILKRGFASLEDAYNWMTIHGVDGAIIQLR